jgi:hypothetical protein
MPKNKRRIGIGQHSRRDGALTDLLVLGLRAERSWFVAKVEKGKRERGQSGCEPTGQPTDMDVDRLEVECFTCQQERTNDAGGGGGDGR